MGTATNLSVTGGTINGQLVVNSATGVIPFISQVNSTEVLRIDSSGNVGIGTTSPSSFGKLAVIAASGNPVSFGDSSASATNNGYLNYSGVSGALILNAYSTGGNTYQALYTSNSGTNAERMRIDSSGNVGIGTTSPSTYGKLAVSGNIYAGDTTSTADGTITIGSAGAGSVAITRTGTGATNSTMTFSTTFATLQERMRIDSSGNVGIGTLSPSTYGKFSVVGSGFNGGNASFVSTSSGNSVTVIGVNGAGVNDVAYYNFTDGANTAFIGLTGTNAAPAGALRFATGTSPTERMRIDSSGNLLVTTTSQINPGSGTQAGINLNAIGQIVGSVNSDTNYFRRTGTDGNLMVFYKVNSAVGGISVTTSATAYATSSDYRLKENIMPMTGGLAKVSALKPVIYTWKSNQSDGQGFIAHELAEVVPQCVIGEKDAVDADGNPQYQGIDTSFLVATLTAAIQEQQDLITQLQADVAALKDKA
jgi:hypothetical protein